MILLFSIMLATILALPTTLLPMEFVKFARVSVVLVPIMLLMNAFPVLQVLSTTIL